MQRLVGTVEIELQKKPWGLAGQFSIHPAGADEPPAGLLSLPLLAGALLVLPALLALIAGVLRAQLGIPNIFDTISRAPVLSLIVVLSLFVGTPLALLINLLPILRLGIKREGDEISAWVALRPNLVQLALLVVALGVAGVFFGHLIADELACLRGIKSAC